MNWMNYSNLGTVLHKNADPVWHRGGQPRNLEQRQDWNNQKDSWFPSAGYQQRSTFQPGGRFTSSRNYMYLTSSLEKKRKGTMDPRSTWCKLGRLTTGSTGVIKTRSNLWRLQNQPAVPRDTWVFQFDAENPPLIWHLPTPTPVTQAKMDHVYIRGNSLRLVFKWWKCRDAVGGNSPSVQARRGCRDWSWTARHHRGGKGTAPARSSEGCQQQASINLWLSQNGWFIMENPIKMDDDWGYPHCRKPPYPGERMYETSFRITSHSRISTAIYGMAWTGAKSTPWPTNGGTRLQDA